MNKTFSEYKTQVEELQTKAKVKDDQLVKMEVDLKKRESTIKDLESKMNGLNLQIKAMDNDKKIDTTF